MWLEPNVLKGRALDWAVAYVRVAPFIGGRIILQQDLADTALRNGNRISSDPSEALALIERAGIATRLTKSGTWQAMSAEDAGDVQLVDWAEYTEKRGRPHYHFSSSVQRRRQRFDGETLILAALRCFVGSSCPWHIHVPDRYVEESGLRGLGKATSYAA
jgi:hypothetical protein